MNRNWWLSNFLQLDITLIFQWLHHYRYFLNKNYYNEIHFITIPFHSPLIDRKIQDLRWHPNVMQQTKIVGFIIIFIVHTLLFIFWLNVLNKNRFLLPLIQPRWKYVITQYMHMVADCNNFSLMQYLRG